MLRPASPYSPTPYSPPDHGQAMFAGRSDPIDVRVWAYAENPQSDAQFNWDKTQGLPFRRSTRYEPPMRTGSHSKLPDQGSKARMASRDRVDCLGHMAET